MTANPLDIIPNTTSPAEVWIEFYNALNDRYGRKEADAIWLKAWGLRGGVSSSANTGVLRDAMQAQGITIDSSAFASVLDTARHTVSNITDGIGDIFNIGKYATIGVLVVIIGGSGLLIYTIARNPNETIKAAK